MKSFRLEKGGSTKNQAIQGGVFLAILGVVMLFIYPAAGVVMILLGGAVAVGGKFAS